MSKEVLKVEGLSKIPDMLTKIQLRKSKAKAYATKLIASLNKNLNKKNDDLAQATILSIDKTIKEINEERMPITRKMDAIKALFTTEEKELKALKGSLQQYRDQYAKQVHEENQAKQREAELANLKKSELVELYASIEMELRQAVQNIIDSFRSEFAKSLKTVTKDNVSSKMEKVIALPSDLNPGAYDTIKTIAKSKYDHDVGSIMDALKAKHKDELFKHYKTSFEDFRQSSLGIMQDIKSEAIKDASKAIKEAEENAKIDSASVIEVAELNTEIQKDAKQAENAFSGKAEVVEEQPESRKGYTIEVVNPAGWAALVAFWFATCAVDFKGNYISKNIGSMMKDLEKHAHKTGEKVESPSVRYVEKFVAVNRA